MYGGGNHRIEFRLLGSVEVAAGNRVIEIGSLKQRALLVALLLRLNHPVPADTLVEDLWGDAPPQSVAQSLQSLASRLKRALETAERDDGAPAGRLRGRDGGYVLEAEPESVDAVRFERLLSAGREALTTGHADAAREAFEAALALWRGPALGDLSDRPFARLEASRLEEARMLALEELAETYLTLGRAEDALARLTIHVGRHPLRERAWGQLMLALYRLGRQADALRAYQQVRHILAEELGVDPTPELRSLEEQILRQSPDLAGPATPPAPAPRSADIVVFLFTDIEASTRRWEGDQEAMANDLARHDGLLLDAVEATGGDVFSHTGDGFCVAYATVPDALRAAVAAQRALLEAAWSSPVPLRVRMAVHAGAAEHRAGNWFGPTLNRASRLLATAAGGQVVCSQVAVDLSRDELPRGVGLVDLGEHRLADLSRPERVYQVTHPDLIAEFPPLQSLDTRHHNLPVALTSFVGREEELAQVLALLESSRLLTLAGTGGAGKTRLALQVAVAALGHFPDGAWFVELASVRDPDQVSAEAVTTLGFLPGGLAPDGESLEERLCDHLQNRRMLLVLDNCEHVIEAAAQLAHTVLARCPDVTVLATSREVLGLPGEVVWKVPPLSLPPANVSDPEALAGCDAVALFCERARAAQPGFGLSTANAAAVAGICRRLDGIPLGLELAAAKIRVLGAHQVAERLDDRFRLLAGGSRMAIPRHQTLRAAVDWSYGLLPAPEQIVLRRLAVFPGTFALAAAEAVVGPVEPQSAADPDFDVLDLLSRLVDKSMVTVFSEEPEARYGLLETIREYAGQKLAEAGEVETIRTRHRDFFLGLADRWAARTKFDDWAPWIHTVVADQESFNAALEWSLAQGDHEQLLRLAGAHWAYWYWTEQAGFWKYWLEKALALCEDPSPSRVEALVGLATLLRWSGRELYRCDPLFDQALDNARSAGSDHLMAQVLFYRSDFVFARGERAAALAMVQEALRIWDEDGFVYGRGWCHFLLGWMALAEHDVDRAGQHFETCLGHADEAGDESMKAHARPGVALVTALRGDHELARLIAAEGIATAELVGEAPRVLMMALARAAQVAVVGDDPAMVSLVGRLVRLLHAKGVSYWADTALELAALGLAGKLPQEAAVIFAASQNLRQELDDVGAEAASLGERVQGCRMQLIELLGPEGWEAASRQAAAMTVAETIGYALTALDTVAD